MESLYELFEKTLTCKSYYNIEIIPHKLFSYSESHTNCKKFIVDHFIKGGKERVLDTEFRTIYEVSGKHEHTVKRFKKLTAREVLENVSIEQIGRQIRVEWTDKIEQQPEFLKWMKNITTAKDWMLVDVSTCKQKEDWCYVTIDCK